MVHFFSSASSISNLIGKGKKITNTLTLANTKLVIITTPRAKFTPCTTAMTTILSVTRRSNTSSILNPRDTAMDNRVTATTAMDNLVTATTAKDNRVTAMEPTETPLC